MRRLLGVLLILGGFLTGAHFVHRLASPVIYTDDFAEDYAAALAIRAGASPYATSASELVARYIPESAGITAGKTFIVPHPPLLPLLVLPLTFVPYSTARGVWLAFELACLVGLSGLLPTGSSWRVKLPLTAALLSWPPVVLELRYGQWALLMALLL